MKTLVMVFGLIMAQSSFAEIEWTSYSDKALKMAQSSGKNVVLGFHKKGCGTCHAQDAALDEAGITKKQNTVFLKVERKNDDHAKVYGKYGFSSRQWAAIIALKGTKEVARVKLGVTSGKSIRTFVNSLN